jgi:hypothetical protein
MAPTFVLEKSTVPESNPMLGLHGGQTAPPQSVPVSAPFCTPSLQVGASHTEGIPTAPQTSDSH